MKKILSVLLCAILMSCATTNIPENHTLAKSNRGTISVSEMRVDVGSITPGTVVGGVSALTFDYPSSCWDLRIEGMITLYVDINESGAHTESRITRGIGGGCDEAALRAFRSATYTPARLADGSPTAARHSVSVFYSFW